MRILLVEDDNGVRNILAKFLVEEKHAVKVAVNGREALRLIEEFTPELVLSDIKMPEMNGLELLEAARAGSEVPFVMVTGYADTDVAVRALRAGAWYFILKPVNFFELKSILDRVQERLALEKELAQERARSVECYDLDDFSAMLGGIAAEIEGPLQDIRSKLSPLSEALNSLRMDLAATRNAGQDSLGARAEDSLGRLEKLLLSLDLDSLRLSNVEQCIQHPMRGKESVRKMLFPLDEALRHAFGLLDSPPDTRVFVSIEQDIVLATDRERFVRTVARLMRIVLRGEPGGPARTLDVSAYREGAEMYLLIAGTGQPRGQAEAERTAATAGGDSGRPENVVEALEFMISSGTVTSLGGKLGHRRPESGGTIFTLRLPLPGMVGAASGPESETHEAESDLQPQRRIVGDSA